MSDRLARKSGTGRLVTDIGSMMGEAMEQKNDISLTIDQKVVAVPEGTTILEAAGKAGIHIPTLCHHPELTPYGGCRLCVVQVDGAPRLAASCVMPVRQGMEVITDNEAITEARRLMLEFIFAEKNHYCMFCAQSGDCELQDLAYKLQMDHLTTQPMGREFPTDTSHPDLVLDHNRCILCGRCVRACREKVGAAVLDFHNRGGEVLIGADLSGKLGESSCVSCGLCLQVCPTGAIFLRHRTHYAVRGKTRDWQEKDSICAECELLCATSIRVKKNNLIKIQGCLGKSDNGPDRGQLCRRGRLDPFRSEPPRLVRPLIRKKNGLIEADWDEALTLAIQGLQDARDRHGPSALIGLVSGAGSLEEIECFIDLTKALKAGYVDVLGGRLLRNLASAGGNGSLPEEVPWTALKQADFILQLGPPLTRTHPVLTQLILRANLENGTTWAVIGPEKPAAPWAWHIPADMDRLPDLVQTLARDTATGSGPNLAAHGLEDLAQAWNRAERPLILAGPSLTDTTDISGLEAVFKLAAKKRSNGQRPGLVFPKAGPNLAGTWENGAASKIGPQVKIFKAGLIDLCGKEADQGQLENLPDIIDFLVVMTPYVTDSLLARAEVVIPRPIGLEEEGCFAGTSGQGPVTRKRVLKPPPGVESGVGVLRRLFELLDQSPAPENGRKVNDNRRPDTAGAGKGS